MFLVGSAPVWPARFLSPHIHFFMEVGLKCLPELREFGTSKGSVERYIDVVQNSRRFGKGLL